MSALQRIDGCSMYTKKATLSIDAIVLKYDFLVKKIAYHLLARLPSSVDIDDLIQAGMMGLIRKAQQTKIRERETQAIKNNRRRIT